MACALILFEAQRQRLAAGLYESRRLRGEEYRRTRFEWLHPTVAAHCQRHGFAYPALDEQGEMLESPPLTPGEASPPPGGELIGSGRLKAP